MESHELYSHGANSPYLAAGDSVDELHDAALLSTANVSLPFDRAHRAFFDQASDAMFVTNDDGVLLEVNDASCILFERSRASFLGCTINAVIDFELPIRQVWQRAIASGQHQGAYRGVGLNGISPWGTYTVTASIWPGCHVWVLRSAPRLNSGHDLNSTERAKWFRTIFEQTTVGIAYGDVHGQLVDVNSTFCAITGYTLDELRSMSYFELTHPDDLERELVYIRQVQQRQISDYTIEKRYIRKDLTLVWVSVTGSPIWNEDGSLEYGVVFVYDISDRKQLEAERQHAEEQLRVQSAALEACANGIVITDTEGTIEWVNPAFAKLTGYELQEAIGKNPRDLIKSDYHDQEFFQSLWNTILAGQAWHGEVFNRRKDGSLYVEEMTITPVMREPKCVSHFIAIKQDVSDRKRAEMSLLEERRLFMAGPTIVFKWRVTDGWAVEYVSANVEKQLGYPPEAFLNGEMSYASLVHPDDIERVAQEVYDYTHQKIPFYEQEYRLRLASGEYAWFHDVTMVIRDAHGTATHYLGYVQNVTERRRMEAALRENDERFRLALEAAHMGSWDWNLLTNQTVWSESLECLVGLEPGSFDGRFETFITLVHPDDRDRVLANVAKALEEGQDYSAEFRLIRPDGGIRWVLGKGKVLFDANGYATRMLGVDVDVTELKQAEFALQQQAEEECLLRGITQHIRRSLSLSDVLHTTATEVLNLLKCDRVLVFRLYPNQIGKIEAEALVPAQAAMAGRMYTLNCELNCYPEACPLMHCVANDALEGSWMECPVSRVLGTDVAAQILIPIPEQDGVWGFLVSQQCDSDRLWQPREIELLTAIANQVSIAIQQSHLYEQVQQFNTQLEQQVQERTAELEQSLHFEALLKRITDKVRDSLDENQILQAVVEELAWGLNVECCDTGIYNEEQTVSTVAYEFTRTLPSAVGTSFPIADAPNPDVYPTLFRGQVCQLCTVEPTHLRGERRNLTILACPLLDDQGVLGDLWLFRDSTLVFSSMEIRLVQQVANQCAIALRQSRLYQSAQKQVQELEQLNQLKDDFLNTVSHELRTPMSNIKMATHMLKLSLEQLNLLQTGHRINQYFQILTNECQRETDLINDLLDLSRLDANVDPLLITRLDLRIWLPAILEPFEQRIAEHQQVLQMHLSEGLPLLSTDLTYLERILTELLQNACKYTPANENIVVSAQVADALSLQSLPTLPMGIAVTLTVSNSGVEIPAEQLQHIFDKFYRIPSNDPWKNGGTGLGLALVKKLVKCLQGHIEVCCRDRQIHFKVTLPCLLEPARPGTG